MRPYILLLFASVYFVDSNVLDAQSQLFKAKPNNINHGTSLETIFNDYTTVNFDSDLLYKHINNRTWSDNITLEISNELSWEFHLEPAEILTDETKIYALTPQGKSLVRAKPTVKSYKGVFADGRDGSIRLTLNDGFFYGMIISEGEEYYIEPLKYYIDGSQNDQFVVYKAKDVNRKYNKHTCFRPNEPITHAEHLDINDSRFSGSCYKAKLAILADYMMYLDPDHPGVDAVVDHIVGVMNNVQAHYEYNGATNFNDGVNFEIGEIVVSTCSSCDPVSNQTNPSSLLMEFSAWVDQNGFNDPFNAAHLWTNRDIAGSTVGVAFQAANLYCTSYARAVLQDWINTASLLKTMVAHEVGHNFNGAHDVGAGYILSPTVTATNTWSPNSQASISSEIDYQGQSCLIPCASIECPKVENIQVSNITNANFTISWTPSASNIYTVKVREYGSTDFIINITTSNTSLVLSPPGYGICKQYDVFVYNNCSSSGLSPVQRLIVKGPTSQGCSDFTMTKTVGWSGNTINFTDKSINATSWFWDFGNGQTSTLQNPIITFANVGSFNVSLRVNNVHTKLKTDAIKILPDLLLPFSLEEGGNFESNTNFFAAELIEGPANVWEFGSSNYVLSTQGKAWKSLLNSDIPLGTSKSALISPRFDFTGFANFMLHFDIGMETIYCNGPIGVQLQYSTNNGISWNLLGTTPSFYNVGPGLSCTFPSQIFADRTGWTFNTNYNHKSLDLSFLSGQSSVVFRFVASITSGFPDGYNVDGVLIDNFRIDAENEQVLPLNVGSLTGKKENQTSVLKWSSYNPSDISSYIIQRSLDGIDFRDIGHVLQENPSNTDFLYIDKEPHQGKNYYRINAFSVNGKSTHSNMVLVNHNGLQKVSIYPNPLGPAENLHIEWEGDQSHLVDIEMIDAVGRVVFIQKLSTNKNMIEMTQYNSGIYHIKIQSPNGTTEYFRFVKI